MYNWSTDEVALKKVSLKKHTVWKLGQLANFGLNGEKIDEKELRTHWGELSIDPWRRKFLSLLLSA